MNQLFVLLSVVAVAMAAPQLQEFRDRFNADARLGNSWNNAERTVVHAEEEVKALPTGRSLGLMSSGRNNWQSHGDAHFLNKEHPKASAKILVQEYKINAPGVYQYIYETDDGVKAEQRANMKADGVQAVDGVYSWVAPNGEQFTVQYMADETGFHAKGAHIPEIPEAIARSIEYNLAHPEEEQMMEPIRRQQQWDQIPGARPASFGRSTWASEASPALPVLETVTKTETAPWETSSTLEAASGRALDIATGRSSSFESGSTGGITKVTKITETKTVGVPTSFAAQPNFPTGRADWPQRF